MRFFISILLLFFFNSISFANTDFDNWVIKYKKYAISKGVSQDTVEESFKNVKLLKRIISYDRKIAKRGETHEYS